MDAPVSNPLRVYQLISGELFSKSKYTCLDIMHVNSDDPVNHDNIFPFLSLVIRRDGRELQWTILKKPNQGNTLLVKMLYNTFSRVKKQDTPPDDFVISWQFNAKSEELNMTPSRRDRYLFSKWNCENIDTAFNLAISLTDRCFQLA